ncbi:MAG: MerR family DNA-binding transcriptional regulator [Candidatus Vogelbacteria bacterium]|nr:MerR family DNA-binding transcriptional regulator [Candidatus Vogelbacteria bacterium]
MSKGHVTIKRAAEVLGVSVETLRNWDKSGKLTAKRDSDTGYRVYNITHLEEFARKSKLRRTRKRLCEST